MNNIKAFNDLIKRYETITIEDIKMVMSCDSLNPGRWAAKALTGFGWQNTCTLCKAATKLGGGRTDDLLPSCEYCVYDCSYGCRTLSKKAEATYDRISDANTPRKLLNAFRARAKYMRTLIDK